MTQYCHMHFHKRPSRSQAFDKQDLPRAIDLKLLESSTKRSKRDICGPPWQMAKAVGEGCVAGHATAKYAKKIKRQGT